MKKYYPLYCTVLYCTVLYCTVLYCTVLYCSIDVFGCDCCRKLCGKSVVKKKTEWEYFKKYNTPKECGNAWKTALLQLKRKDNGVVPVVWEQHDKTKGCVFSEKGEATMLPIPKDMNVQTIYRNILNIAKNKLKLDLKSFVLYFNGDPNLKYDGTNTKFGKKSISDEDFLFDKNSDDPLLQRAVFISYYAERDA